MSNNFPACRNPARVARIDGGVAEAEAAGGSPRKKPHGSSPRKKPRGEGTFLLRLDRAKATAECGWMEPIKLEGDLEDWTEGGRPRKAPPKTTKPPPITQEDDGFGDLASEEEEVDSEDDEGLEAGIASCDEARRLVQSISARPRGAKCDGGVNDGCRPKEDDDEERDAFCNGATCKFIPACPRGTKREGGKNDWTNGGGRPKNSLKMTGDLDDDNEVLDDGDIGDLYDEDPDYGDIEDDEAPEDEGKTAPVMWAGNPQPPQVSAALFDSTEVFGSTAVGKTQGKTGQGGSAANFLLGTAAGGD